MGVPPGGEDARGARPLGRARIETITKGLSPVRIPRSARPLGRARIETFDEGGKRRTAIAAPVLGAGED